VDDAVLGGDTVSEFATTLGINLVEGRRFIRGSFREGGWRVVDMLANVQGL
jgi:hypothetical protein